MADQALALMHGWIGLMVPGAARIDRAAVPGVAAWMDRPDGVPGAARIGRADVPAAARIDRADVPGAARIGGGS